MYLLLYTNVVIGLRYAQGSVGATTGETVSGAVNLLPYTTSATLAPTSPPTAPTPAPTYNGAHIFGLVQGIGNCAVSSNGQCLTDGSGSYGNNYACVWLVLKKTSLLVNSFALETNWDWLGVCAGGTSASVSTGSSLCSWYA